MLRAKFAVLTLALALVVLTPLNCQAGIAGNDSTTATERGTRAVLQPATELNWGLDGLFSLLRSGR
jgi:hypothetical protein